MSLKKEVARDNRVMANWLLFYHEHKADYLKAREEILHSSAGPRESGLPGDRTHISDITGKKATKLAEMRKTEMWLSLVEEIERRLPSKMLIILLMRREYRYSRRGEGHWRARVEGRYKKDLAAVSKIKEDDIKVSERMVREWWERILEYGCRIAGKRGLL